MKSPEDMRIIQIDITNACIHRCSNCTRFCGHHKKPFFMDYETFKKAVDSFEGFNGTVGIMGGEPTLHPEFERFLTYLNNHKYYPKTENLLTRPTDKFMKTIALMEQRDTFINHDHGIDRRCVQGYGLWSALSNNYTKYYELIQDTFNFQALNDHTNIMYHSPIMVRRKDLGVSDEEWITIRDNCWAQSEWSATITPKGAFFCEIAGALDMLFDGPGGWPIEPGWWKRKPDEFGEQLKWCEICGIAMSTFTRDANEEIDDMSQWYYEKLSELGSPKLKEGLYNVLKIDEEGNIDDECKAGAKEKRKHLYLDSYFSRFNESNDWLNPSAFVGIVIVNNSEKLLEYADTIKRNAGCLSKTVVVVDSSRDADNLRTMLGNLDILILTEETPGWGIKINKVFRNYKEGKNPFYVLINYKTILSKSFDDGLKKYVLNPGSILVPSNDDDAVFTFGENIDAIFSPRALAIKRATAPAIAKCESVTDFISFWDEEKVIPLDLRCFTNDEYQVEEGVRYAIYGCGPTAENLLCNFAPGQIVMAIDSNCDKWGEKFHDFVIESPETLLKKKNEYDKVFITSKSFFEIKDKLIEMGIEMSKIVSSISAM